MEPPMTSCLIYPVGWSVVMPGIGRCSTRGPRCGDLTPGEYIVTVAPSPYAACAAASPAGPHPTTATRMLLPFHLSPDVRQYGVSLFYGATLKTEGHPCCHCLGGCVQQQRLSSCRLPGSYHGRCLNCGQSYGCRPYRC